MIGRALWCNKNILINKVRVHGKCPWIPDGPNTRLKPVGHNHSLYPRPEYPVCKSFPASVLSRALSEYHDLSLSLPGKEGETTHSAK